MILIAVAVVSGGSRSRRFEANGIAAKTGISLLLRATLNFIYLFVFSVFLISSSPVVTGILYV